MHTYSKNGLRKVKVQQKVVTKKHLKGFYQTLGKIDELAKYLKSLDVEITKENINVLAKPYTGRDLDQLETILVLGKINEEKLGYDEKNNSI